MCVVSGNKPIIARYLFLARCSGNSFYVWDVVRTIEEPTESQIVSVVTMYRISNV